MMEVMALKMNPSITPKISSVVAFLRFRATVATRIEVSSEPAKAAAATVSPDSAAGSEAPIRRVAAAAPVPAPALTPMMCGSARGFLKTLCI